MKLFTEILGKGKKNIVLLHGWGLNSQIWKYMPLKNNKHFKFHLIDLPGYGKNHNFSSLSIDDTIEAILNQIPKDSILLGWSLGGLIATLIAIKHQNKISSLITVSSSPFFIKNKQWPGIELKLLENFKKELEVNFYKTVERFIDLQTINYKKKSKESIIKSKILKQPFPKISVLQKGLDILKKTDLRKDLSKIYKPFIRIYGDLDTLVPKKVVPLINKLSPKSYSIIIKHASHAPFISHFQYFIKIITNYTINC